MRPVLNVMPKEKMFLCEMRINGNCERDCVIGAGDPHTHEKPEGNRFYCEVFREDIWCREI